MSSPPSTTSLLVHAAGIIILSLLWGVAQERVGATRYCDLGEPATCERFSAIPVMALAQAVIAAAVAGVGMLVSGAAREGSFTDLLPASISHTIASPIGYLAMRFLPYPLFILISSCKLVPVLIVGILVNRTVRRPVQDFISAAIMTQGVVLYSHAQATGGGAAHKHGGAAPSGGAEVAAGNGTESWLGMSLSPAGLLIVGISCTLTNLMLEGFTNASQDSLLRRARAAGRPPMPPLQMQFDMNAWGVVLLSIALGAEWLAHGSSSMLSAAGSFAWRHPEVVLHVSVFAITGAIAQLFIFSAISAFGGFTTTCITVTRKVFSVLISVALFGHSLTVTQYLAIANVFGGLALQLSCGSTHELAIIKRVDGVVVGGGGVDAPAAAVRGAGREEGALAADTAGAKPRAGPRRRASRGV